MAGAGKGAAGGGHCCCCIYYVREGGGEGKWEGEEGRRAGGRAI